MLKIFRKEGDYLKFFVDMSTQHLKEQLTRQVMKQLLSGNHTNGI